MEIQQLDILLRLVIAHLLADFVFQTDKMVNDKNKQGLKSGRFYLHLFIVGITAYILLAEWSRIWIPLLVMVVHGAIDFIKIKIRKNNVWVYVGDQVAHIFSLVLIWLMITDNSLSQLVTISKNYQWSDRYLLICAAYILIAHPAGVLIAYLTRTWQDELEADGNESLRNAGKWIGIIERILILTFILLNEWGPIGFLLAAKSVFRFGDLKEGKEHKKTEYILIGTLLSFTLAIFLGILVQGMLE